VVDEQHTSGTWITARLEGDTLSLTVSGRRAILEDDEEHRTRTVTAQFDLGDPAAMRSARAVLVPLTAEMFGETPESKEARAQLEPRRLKAIPDLDEAVITRLREAFTRILADYDRPLRRMLRQHALVATMSALSHDLHSTESMPQIGPEGALSIQVQRASE
jgi:hypothetical protein